MQIDSGMTLDEALSGLEFPSNIRKTLALVDVSYLSFDGRAHQGQLVLHQELAGDVQVIFDKLVAYSFPIQKAVPIVAYDWDDEMSMRDNNTSAFNYRRIIATNQFSNHSTGRAVDINPFLNPYFARDGRVYPAGAAYDPTIPGTITPDSDTVKLFKERGWEWLGEREQNKDYQHFQKLA